MSMNISGLGNTYNGINTNSKQYKEQKMVDYYSANPIALRLKLTTYPQFLHVAEITDK